MIESTDDVIKVKDKPGDSNKNTKAKKSKKKKAKLPLYVPPESVSDCPICKRNINALLLRFKHNCRLCGHVFCNQCMKQITLPQFDIHKNVSVCIPCYEHEMKHRERKKHLVDKKKQIEEEKIHLQELFEELHKAYEKDDEERAIEIKANIDVLKESLIKREQRELEIQERKNKAKDDLAEKKKIENTTKHKDKRKVNSHLKNKKKKILPKDPDTPEMIQKTLDEKCSLPFEKVFYQPNEGKCCLVLDIDYTLFDHRWYEQVREDLKKEKSLMPEFKRPYLHEFLETCYDRYDIVIWSATNMIAIDSKCSNLGIYSNEHYKVNLVLSKDHMLFINKKGTKSMYQETVKPLEVIWRNFPQYSSKNTIHIDDLKTNFQLNPNNGILIPPFKEASKNNEDTELIYLTKYLLLIANGEDDFSSLNHSKWKEYTISKLWEKQNELTVPKFVEEKSKMGEIVKSSEINLIKLVREKSEENNNEGMNKEEVTKSNESVLPDIFMNVSLDEEIDKPMNQEVSDEKVDEDDVLVNVSLNEEKLNEKHKEILNGQNEMDFVMINTSEE